MKMIPRSDLGSVWNVTVIKLYSWTEPESVSIAVGFVCFFLFFPFHCLQFVVVIVRGWTAASGCNCSMCSAMWLDRGRRRMLLSYPPPCTVTSFKRQVEDGRRRGEETERHLEEVRRGRERQTAILVSLCSSCLLSFCVFDLQRLGQTESCELIWGSTTSEVFWRKVSFSQEAVMTEKACLLISKRRRPTEEE